MSCEYCRGEKPLTDKIYEDGSRFDDLHGTRIEYIGAVPVIKSYIKPKYIRTFQGLAHCMTDEQIQFMCCQWAVEINICPICGEPLTDSKPLIQEFPEQMIRRDT